MRQTLVVAPLVLGVSLLLASCNRDEVTHFRVAKTPPAGGGVEAMASHRPYRPGLGIEKALAEVENNRGKLYDPQVVDACLRLFRAKGYTLPA